MALLSSTVGTWTSRDIHGASQLESVFPRAGRSLLGNICRLSWLPQCLEMSQLKCQLVLLQCIYGLKKSPPRHLFSVLTKTLLFFFPHPPFYFCACQLVAKISNFPYMKVFLAEVHEDFLPLFLNARVNVLKAVLPRVQVGVQCQVSTSWLPPVRDSWLAVGLGRGSPLYVKRRGP